MNKITEMQTKPMSAQARAIRATIRASVMILVSANQRLEAQLAIATAENVQLEAYVANLQKRLVEAQGERVAIGLELAAVKGEVVKV